MRLLQIGLGSMGKRRIRCLKKLGYSNILGFDLREDRRKEAKSLYDVEVIGDIRNVDFDTVDFLIISTPPDKHDEYLELAINKRKPSFIEASVVLGKLRELDDLAKKSNIFVAPSCTLRFHPAIRDIKNIIKSKQYGKLTNFSYHSGQYLRDWHPYEDIKDFYVSKRETGGAREIVPFELTWIIDIAGFPKTVMGFCGSTMDIGADIDDTYLVAMEFEEGGYGALTVDVVSRYATRSLILNMEYGQILWRWDDNVVKLYDAATQRWIHYYYPHGQTVEGYNKNIIEDMYVEELRSAINAIENKQEFQNSLDEDIKVLELLERVEKEYAPK